MQNLCVPTLNDTLRQLMQGVQAGDERAFEHVYDLTVVQVARVVARTVRVPEHSDEVVQEVYLHVWQHARSFDPTRGSLMGWLVTLAHRRAVDRVRHVVQAVARDQRNADEEELASPDVAELGLARIEAAQLHAALRRLTLKQREAVVLIYLHGWPYAHAAQHLGVPVGTLKTRARAGVAALRRGYPAPWRSIPSESSQSAAA